MSLRSKLFATAFALGTLVVAPSHAVILTSVDTAPENVVTNFSAPGLLSFDLDLARANPATTLTYQIEAGDGAQLDFNAIVRNLLGEGIGYFELSLANATFSIVGSAERAFGPAPSVTGGGSAAVIGFNPQEFFEFFVGDPLASGAGTNWGINIAGLTAGDQFSLTLAVAEPATPALLLGGLAAVLGLRRRRTQTST